jgi:hypothetical protein
MLSLAGAHLAGLAEGREERAFSSSRAACDAGPASASGAPRGASTSSAATSGAAPPSLSEAQQAELASLVLSSFKRDPATSATILSRALDEAARKELRAALGKGGREPPPLSRAAIVDEAADTAGPQAEAEAEAAAPAAAAAAAPATAAAAKHPAEPSFRQLLWVAASKGLPFVAFGFCDNLIMVGGGSRAGLRADAALPPAGGARAQAVGGEPSPGRAPSRAASARQTHPTPPPFQITAGEQIDLAFGAKLGLSSMAAAGLGNAVADVVGINISHSIEVRAGRGAVAAATGAQGAAESGAHGHARTQMPCLAVPA